MSFNIIPIDANSVIYARPMGTAYHLDRNCMMLRDGDFERLRYRIIKLEDIKKRNLIPCRCACENKLVKPLDNG